MTRLSIFTTPAASCAAAALCAMGMTSTPVQAAGSIRAAYVEQVIPSRPYFGTLSVSTTGRAVLSAGSSILGITSLVLTNLGAASERVILFQPLLSGAGCDGQVTGSAGVELTVVVLPNSTSQLTFPTPLVLSPVNGVTCFAAAVEGQATVLNIAVSGLLN